MAFAFFGGVHPHDMKAATNGKAIQQLSPPLEVVIPMSMHFGAPCAPLVRKGDRVKVGQKIGETRGLGAPIHASVSGTVKAVEPRPYSMGGDMLSVVIENDFQDEISEEVRAPADPDALSVEEMVEAVKNAGIVGMGGATFPTHVKISGGIGKVDTVIINGAECEPYITGDHRTMLERPEEIVGGCTYLAKMFGVDQVTIGVEDNKQDGIASLNAEIQRQGAKVQVVPLRCRYPQGGEKQLCQAITGKQVPPGGLPSNIGCAVFNINTTCAIYRAIRTGMPVVRKIVTVSGSGVVDPRNLECPIGTPVSCLFDACGGLKDGTYKIIAGGPMMGMAQYTADISVGKGTGAMLAFCEDEEQTVEHPQCIRCGKCVAACPMRLEPLFMYQYASKDMLDELDDARIMDCMECGACAYACPARMHLTHMFKYGKQKLKDRAAAQKAAAEAKKAKEEAEKARADADTVVSKAKETEKAIEAAAKAEKAEREAQEAKARAEREAQEAKAKAEREAQEAKAKAEREAQEAKAKAEQEAQEAKAKAEREAQEAKAKAEREAQEAKAKAEREAQEAKAKAEREAQEAREAEARAEAIAAAAVEETKRAQAEEARAVEGPPAAPGTEDAAGQKDAPGTDEAAGEGPASGADEGADKKRGKRGRKRRKHNKKPGQGGAKEGDVG